MPHIALMSFFGKFFKKKRSQNNPYEFSNEDREAAEVAALEKTIKRQRLRRMKDTLQHLQEVEEEQALQERISRLEEKLYDDDDANPEDILNPEMLVMNLITNFMQKKGGAPAPIQQNTFSPPEITTEQIREMKNKLPAESLKQLKNMPTDELCSVLLDKFPQADDNTIKKAVQVIKE